MGAGKRHGDGKMVFPPADGRDDSERGPRLYAELGFTCEDTTWGTDKVQDEAHRRGMAGEYYSEEAECRERLSELRADPRYAGAHP